MARRTDARESLLAAGVELFLEGGYDFTGTNTILERASAPRGSFYHHFGDKLGFALATAEHYYERHLPLLDRILADEACTPLQRLRRYFEVMRHSYEQEGWSKGCLLGMLSQELADREPEAREALAALFGRWRHRLAAGLREAQAHGELGKDEDCDELASALLEGWEGALMAMKVAKSGAPLDRFMQVTLDRLLTRG
ncbi:MAG: TetR family transcriptional regulator C-terminal domain-containing protein [Myxococcota bacterium]